jgi:transcription antitermination factor NusG
MPWTLIKTPAQTQTRYVSQVEEFHPSIPIYIPTYKHTTRPHGRRLAITIIKPVYPGYIFAQPDLTLGEHYYLTRLPTKAYFVRFGREISLIPERVIEELRRLESLHLLSPRQDQNDITLHPGQKIRVAFPTIDVVGTLIYIIAQAKAVVDTPLGTVTVALARCAPHLGP